MRLVRGSRRGRRKRRVTRGGALGALHGVPMTIKCNIDVAGLACPAGSPLRADYVPAIDAPLVARLRAAGAIILGNTNTPEFLMAWESNNQIRGGDEQSVEFGALGGRIERRRGGGDFVGVFVWRDWERWRRVDSRAGALLRDLRAEADAGARAVYGTLSGGSGSTVVAGRRGADGADDRRCAGDV